MAAGLNRIVNRNTIADCATPGLVAAFAPPNWGKQMAHHGIMRGALVLALVMGGAASASAQGVLDKMKEDAQRRAENKAVRDAENPAPTKATDQGAAPAAPAAPAQSTATAPAAAPQLGGRSSHAGARAVRIHQ